MRGKPIIQLKAMKKIKIQTIMLLLYMMKIKKYIKHIYKNSLNLRFLQVESYRFLSSGNGTIIRCTAVITRT